MLTAGPTGAVLQPWDQDFYTRQLALSQPGHADAAAAAAPYLRLGSVLQGLSELLQQLMGLTLQRRQLGPGEGWGAGEGGRRSRCGADGAACSECMAALAWKL
jgi:Zn-dependent oligopeptidase